MKPDPNTFRQTAWWFALALVAVRVLLSDTARAQVNISVGTLQPGDSVTLTYDVTIDNNVSPSVTQITSQGSVSGSNFASVGTDDPETPAADDETVTPLEVNDPPVANPDTIFRNAGENVKVLVATLLANDTDAENDPITLTAVHSPSAGGATVTLNGDWIYYLHIGTAADSFTYDISDGQGGTATGTVTVSLKPNDAQFRSTLTITVDGSGAHIRSDGIPGFNYTIQYKDDVNDPWQTLGTALANETGIYTWDDPAGTVMRIYRSVFF